MIIAIDRGNGLTELICKEEGEDENVYQADEPDPCGLPDAASDKLHRNKSTVKGCYCGRDGITVVFDRLLCSGRKPGGYK